MAGVIDKQDHAPIVAAESPSAVQSGNRSADYGTGFGYVFAGRLDDSDAAPQHWTSYRIVEYLTCSPKTGPCGMRVLSAHLGKETLDERQEAQAGADHPEAA